MYIKLNPQYAIRNEPKCSYLIKISTCVDPLVDEKSQFVNLLPPFIGCILSDVGKYEYPISITHLSEKLGISFESIDNFVTQMIENVSRLSLNIADKEIILPQRVLIKSSKKIKNNIFTSKGFSIHDDLEEHRPLSPININFMVTTKCNTNCIYCYADKRKKDDLSTKDIKNILHEARKIGVVNLTLTGGDVLAHPDWKDIVSTASKLGYNPLISTKTTICKEDVEFLKKIGVTTIQISLDSLNGEILKKLLHVDDLYKDRMLEMIKYLNDLEIKVTIRTVLTKYNSDINTIRSMIKYFKTLSCIESWVITPAFISEYKKEYDAYSISNDVLKSVYLLTKNIRTYFPIIYNKINQNGYALHKFDTVENFVRQNQNCYANSYSMSIISNGKVNICEMLYETSQFIIGSTKDNTLKDIWNSKKALSLFSYKQKSIKNKKDNPCYICSVYHQCKETLVKKICYVDIVKIYGAGKMDYPDIRCPYSMKYDEKYIL